MNIVVQKYSGAAVRTSAQAQTVADWVKRSRGSDRQLVVVVSPAAEETKRLLRLARDLSSSPDARELDVLLTTSGMISSARLALALASIGCSANALTGMQSGILTNSAYSRACIRWIDCRRLYKTLENGVIPVVAGSQGVNAAQNLTTLGQEGSDLTAVVLASALKAERCEIYVDMPSHDHPRWRMAPQVHQFGSTLCDALQAPADLRGEGDRPLARAFQLAKRLEVPIVLKSSFIEGSEVWDAHTREGNACHYVSVSEA